MKTKLMMFAAAVAVAFGAWAFTETVGGYTWTYRINGGTAEIYGEKIGNIFYAAISTNSTGAVTIPSTLGGKPVTSISDKAFSGCSGLTSVTIGNGVTSIGDYAFDGCSGLTSVTIPDSVTSIGDHAFCNCSGLTSVTIPDSVTNIGSSAFGVCNGLTSVHITDLARWCGISFGDYGANPLYCAHDLYLNGAKVTTLTIPNSVTSIASYAFYNCSGLTSVTIPDSVTSIGSSAFGVCNGLTSVHITDLARWCGISFGDYEANPLYCAHDLYLNGAKVTTLTIPNSVTSIARYAFSHCSSLTSVTIPDSVTNIASSAFHDCRGLTSVTIGNGVTSIASYAFYNCSGLTSVTIPDSVTSIGDQAFSGCSGLTSVHITDLARWCGISFGDYGANPLYCAHDLYLNGAKVTTLTIPNSVTSIGESAFSHCSSLTSVTIPDSVTNIASSAFSGCSGLTSVTIGNGVTSIGHGAFGGCSGLTSVTIGNGVTSIGDYAFDGCSESLFDTTTIPGVKLVDGWVVGKRGSLSGNLDLTGVRGIGYRAFGGCSGLTSVTIGNGVTGIGGGGVQRLQRSYERAYNRSCEVVRYIIWGY